MDGLGEFTTGIGLGTVKRLQKWMDLTPRRCSKESCEPEGLGSRSFFSLARRRTGNAADIRGWLSILSTETGDGVTSSANDPDSISCLHSVPGQRRMLSSAGEEGQVEGVLSGANEKRSDEGSCCEESHSRRSNSQSMDSFSACNFFRFPGLLPFAAEPTAGKRVESDTGETARYVGVPNIFVFLMRIGATVAGKDQGNSDSFASSFSTNMLSEPIPPAFSQPSSDLIAEEKFAKAVETPTVLPAKNSDGETCPAVPLERACFRGESRAAASALVARTVITEREESVMTILRASSVSEAVREWVKSLGTTDEEPAVAVPFVTEDAAKLLWKSACSLVANPVVAFYCQCYALASLGAVVFATSIIHWWRPLLGIRRTIDVTAVVIVASIHWLTALFLTDITFQAVYFLITWTGVLCYFGGCTLAARGHSMPGAWCHVGLHSICTVGNICLYMYLAFVVDDSVEKAALVPSVSETVAGMVSA
ncbi:putative transmembrane protein [Toxoplasma gondii MAS]|uniref:Putative transmembrane protein n=2 Tax=Toxoplasma gondii TaxID=5811 RepID=A0A086Q4J8_TOXGO|nr:putative transmembrane protein [Toxoplasma gondii MAS]PUA85589.1 putative transmembrane protein [Toxoplasma gondii TgCATBr9]